MSLYPWKEHLSLRETNVIKKGEYFFFSEGVLEENAESSEDFIFYELQTSVTRTYWKPYDEELQSNAY